MFVSLIESDGESSSECPSLSETIRALVVLYDDMKMAFEAQV